VLCVVRWRSLRRADHSSRGVLPSAVCLSVCSRNLGNEEAMAHWRVGGNAVSRKERKKYFNLDCKYNHIYIYMSAKQVAPKAAHREIYELPEDGQEVRPKHVRVINK